ncbi:Universal stress protein family protein [Tritonibacter multivorans]|uniref:Universal stress protein family protein n=1 Tax=Tritonibacter multivorans TaxID=928856 RepID=A0A0N7LYY5_9RHOB|nr:universal stress protein [Tritonibacter multivorans]MDA7419780.1 universal stress protein [Tritonibacter multivorans]CUH76161.1 Universal stress protein family protein [Tritonibacter multivorans]SFC54146.1 Universal stress protein family protein [Tritonibacter multivorans]
MTYKTILATRTAPDQNHTALAQAEAIAAKAGGHLDVLCIGIDHTRTAYYDSTASAITVQHAMEQAQSVAKSLRAETNAQLKTSQVPFAVEATVARSEEIGRLVGHHARYADLMVAGLPYGPGANPEDESIVEAALFDARVPVLALPTGTTLEPPRQVVVAWDESIEALTAAKKALPLLQQADLVRIVVVDPPRHGPERSDPGGRLCQLLVRHGISCEIDILSRTLPRISDVLLRHVQDCDANLLVMGAYGHSRFREAILGGTTRSMLEHATLPVFLAH